MHTNILINSNFETFTHTNTVHMNDFFVFCFYCFYSRKNMTTLYSQYNSLYAHALSSTIVNHQIHKQTMIMNMKSLNCSRVQMRLLFGPPENCNFIECVYAHYSSSLSLFVRFIPFSFELGWCSVKVFACCTLSAICLFIMCNTNEMNCEQLYQRPLGKCIEEKSWSYAFASK